MIDATKKELQSLHKKLGSQSISAKKAFIYINDLNINNTKLNRQNPGHTFCIQKILSQFNYYESNLDGRYGPKTKKVKTNS